MKLFKSRELLDTHSESDKQTDNIHLVKSDKQTVSNRNTYRYSFTNRQLVPSTQSFTDRLMAINHSQTR